LGLAYSLSLHTGKKAVDVVVIAQLCLPSGQTGDASEVYLELLPLAFKLALYWSLFCQFFTLNGMA